MKSSLKQQSGQYCGYVRDVADTGQLPYFQFIRQLRL